MTHIRMNNGSNLLTRSEANANTAITASACGRRTLARRIASAVQPTASSHKSAIQMEARHTGCHSMMFARERRTVSAMKIHSRTPWGFTRVASVHAAGTPSVIQSDGRSFAPVTPSTVDHSHRTPTPTIQPPCTFAQTANANGRNHRRDGAAFRAWHRTTTNSIVQSCGLTVKAIGVTPRTVSKVLGHRHTSGARRRIGASNARVAMMNVILVATSPAEPNAWYAAAMTTSDSHSWFSQGMSDV